MQKKINPFLSIFFLFYLVSCSDQEIREEFENHNINETFIGTKLKKTSKKNIENVQQTKEDSNNFPLKKSSPNLKKHIEEYSKRPPQSEKYFSFTNENPKELEVKIEKKFEENSFFILTTLRNKELLSLEKKYKATKERYPQALDLINSLSQYESFTSEIGVAQPLKKSFPYPGLLSLKSQVIWLESEMSFINWQKGVRNKISKAKMLHASLYFIEHSIEITNEIIELLKLLEKTVSEKYKSGETGQVALLKIQVEIFELQNELVTLHQKRETLKASVNLLMDFNISKPLGKIRELKVPENPFNSKKLSKASLKYQHEINYLKLKKQKIEKMIAMAERKSYPNISSKQSLISSRAPRTKQKKIMVPDTFFGSSNAFIREMKVNLKAVSEQILELENQAKLSIEETWLEFDTQKRLQKLYETELIPQATQSFHITQSAYFNNKSDFLNVIDGIRLLLKFKLKEVKAVSETYKAIALIEKSTGILLNDLVQKTK